MRRRIAGGLAIIGVLLGAGGVVLNKTHAVALGSAQIVGLTGMALFLSAVLLATFSMAPVDAETPHITEGRARLRDAERVLEEALRVHVASEVEGGAAEQQESPTDSALTLPALWEVTHSRLDLYHAIALGQARRSFRNAQMASGAGFALLAIFVVVALRASTTAGSVVAGSLGAVAAALSGYISRTFVKSAEGAAAHLHAYFEQPLEFSRYLAAERMVRDGGLDGKQRAEVLAEIAKVIVAGSPGPHSTNDVARQAAP